MVIKIKSRKAIIIKAAVTPQIPDPLNCCQFNSKNKKNPKGLSSGWYIVKNVETCTPGLQIGDDYYIDIILDESKKIQGSLYVINSKLWWIISGRASSTNNNVKENIMLALTPASSYLPGDIHLVNTKRDAALLKSISKNYETSR